MASVDLNSDNNAEDMDEEYQVFTRMEDITEQDDKNLAGAKKEIRNDLTVIIPENPFPEIEVDAYPPLKFSWVIPKKLAAMAFPRNKENLQFLVNQGITHLVTLTAGKKPPMDDMPRLRWSEVPIEEFELPTLEQIKKFIDICKRADKNEEVIGIHCRQGRSRSGVLLACYLVHFHRFLPDQAINVIQMIRPGSCNSPEHEEAIGRYFEHLTEDNPLKFGVSSSVMDEFIEQAGEATKNGL
ncbi:dual specificity protein phosphatase 23-like [Hyposmocoma kahamanoa]|uniref:dual specificity protein phosphatase 23-like n=1 Tax=Hyposmocoma kahamanoa TaxID=1477025 RepID=UPI000E6D6D48|nr:dual specificity protein phosphatase 23-like [Hyposmocoma kahamanoa]